MLINKRKKKNTNVQKPRRFWTISKKMVALCQIPMVVICGIITIFSINSFRKSIEDDIEKSLRIVASSVNETYTNLYEGDYTKSIDGKIQKGGVALSSNTSLIDGVHDKTGFDVSFIYGDMRVITTIKREAGGKATGLKIEQELYDSILEGDDIFLTDTEIDVSSYYAYYQPLINSDGTVIGSIEAVTSVDGVKTIIRTQTIKLVLFSAVFLVLAAILVMLLARRMVITMRGIRRFLSHLSEGELDAAPDKKLLKQNDELGDIYNMSVCLQKALRDIVNNIKISSDNLTTSADRLSDMAQDTQNTVDGVLESVSGISVGAKTQAEGTADTNGNVTKIREQIIYIADEVDLLTDYARKMYDAEKESEKIIHELNSSNESTKASVSQAAEQILLMNNSVENINTAVSMIQSIADETDLLSLNASIEAARAGEAGRGFAVVAEQICRLAEQSNQSASEIEKMIGEIMTISKSMVSFMELVKENMNHQQDKLEDTKTKYKAVSEGVENSLENIESIKKQIDELGGFGTAIQSAVQNLAQISEKNALSADDTMHAAMGMSDTMNDLKVSSMELLCLADKLQKTLVTFKS